MLKILKFQKFPNIKTHPTYQNSNHIYFKKKSKISEFQKNPKNQKIKTYLKTYVLYGNSTMRTASKFGAILPKFHQHPAYVALFREKT